MVWREVGAQHLAMLGAAAAQRCRRRQAVVDDDPDALVLAVHDPRRVDRRSDVPPVRRHLGRLSDDLGVAQHAVGATPDLRPRLLHRRCGARVGGRHPACRTGRQPRQWRDRSADTSPSWTRPSSRVTGASATSEQRMVGGSRRSAPRTATGGRSRRWARPLCERPTDAVRGLASDIVAAALPACLDLRHLRPWAYSVLGCERHDLCRVGIT